LREDYGTAVLIVFPEYSKKLIPHSQDKNTKVPSENTVIQPEMIQIAKNNTKKCGMNSRDYQPA